MVRIIDAVILVSGTLPETRAFYERLGLTLEEERHDDGPLHYTCDLGPVHFAIFEATRGVATPPDRGVGGSTLVSFEVDAVDEVVARLRVAGSAVVVEPEEAPWGRRAIVTDPDGRLVELNEPRAR